MTTNRNSKSRTLRLVAGLGCAALSMRAAPVQACGGFFCSQAQPVNQAAERIIFSQNDDGTVTAVIQILYEGPSEDFSWLLPIASVPDADGEIAVASNLAFQRLQAATNPQYTLNTTIEGTCGGEDSLSAPRANAGAAGGAGSSGVDFDDDGGVTVAASGVVGQFDWTALELDASLEDPAGAALEWLTENGYDVLPQSAELIGPYLASGMYLLALRLTKGADTGSIRPIVLTYDGELPSIPIKLTAVAANDDMGVMTWMLSSSRAVPMNYNALELNEARINWFNPASNYESVVIAAANDSGGQGFVTEFAGASSALDGVIWAPVEEADWQATRSGTFNNFAELFNTVYGRYGSFDGFWDSVRASVTLPENLRFEDFRSCPNCYSEQISFTPSTFLDGIEQDVIQPVRLVQELVDARPYLTRLYSTLSAAEMTTDPVFTYNTELPEVSNVHTATRVIECNPRVSQSQAPWRIEMPGGGVVRGTPETFGTWPDALAAQPANSRVLTLSSTGTGLVTRDNSEQISQMLGAYNESVVSNQSGAFTSGSDGCGIARAGSWSAALASLGAVFAALAGLSRRRTRARRPG